MIGVEATTNRFDFLFGLVLGERVLQHTDDLSKTLQALSLTASEGQQVADPVKHFAEAFDLFWEKVQWLQREYRVDEPRLPRKRKAHHLEVGCGENFHPSTAKEFYSQQYFERLDFVTSAIQDCVPHSISAVCYLFLVRNGK